MAALGWILNLGFGGSEGAAAAVSPAVFGNANQGFGRMKKNVASQVVGVQMLTAADGTAFTGSATVVVTIDGGVPTASGGTGPTHETSGYHTYLPTQAETNGDLVAFTFTGSGAAPVTREIYTGFPQTGDGFALIGTPAADLAADIAAVKSDTAATLVDTADMQPKIGTPAADLAADIAAVKSDSAAILTDTGTTIPATLGTPAADISADIAAVKVDTAATLVDTGTTIPGTITTLQSSATAIEADTQDLQTQIGTAGAGLTDLGGMSTTMKAQVNTEADTALTDYDAPTNAEMEARTPTAAQLAYMTENAAVGVPVTFTGGTTTTAVLGNVDGSAASSVDDFYNGAVLIFNAGTLANQRTDITDYNGTTKTATITAVTTAVTSGHTARLV